MSQRATEMMLTCTQLDRHGASGGQLRAAIEGDGPGGTLEQYAEVVARQRSC